MRGLGVRTFKMTILYVKLQLLTTMFLCRYHSVLKQQTLRVAISEVKAELGYQLRGVKGGKGGMNIGRCLL
jgi:hypothetical protein